MANQVVNAAIIADSLSLEVPKQVKFMPFAKVTNINAQTATVGVTKRQYGGDAQVVAPGQLIPASDFIRTRIDVPVIKLADRIVMTEEEMLSDYGTPAEDIKQELLERLAGGLDSHIVGHLSAITGGMVHDATVEGAVTKAVLADALAKFGERQENVYLFVNKETRSEMLKNDDFIIKSAQDGLNIVGEIYGVQVVLSERVPAGEAFLLKQDALHLYLRKDIQVTPVADAETQTQRFVGVVYFAAVLANESGAVKIDLQA